MTAYAPYGYICEGTTPLTQATSVSFTGQSGAQFLKTLTGDSGFSDGIPEVDIAVDNAVPKTASEMGRILTAWIQQREITFRIRFANFIFTVVGKITEIDGGTAVGSANKFSFKFHGAVDASSIQQVAA